MTKMKHLARKSNRKTVIAQSITRMTDTYSSLHRDHKTWVRVVSVLGCLVVFVTTYALILPAITLESEFDPNVTYCGVEEHIHCDDCYEVSRILKCTIENDVEHIHSDECYEEQKTLICTQMEHQHELQCYSNPTADLESYTDWEKPFSNIVITGDWSKDIITVAESQLDYKESVRNYKVADDNSIHGYTRYGAWFGRPYDEWNTMFLSFCLNYSLVPNYCIPYYYDCNELAASLIKTGAYTSFSYKVPEKGDLLFFDADSDAIPDRVGIIADVSDNSIEVIEGDNQKTVLKTAYPIDDPSLLAYIDLSSIYTAYKERLTSSEVTAMIYTDESYSMLSETSDAISLCGILPEDITVKAYPVTANVENQKIVTAYDITMFLPSGAIYEPDKPLSVVLKTNALQRKEKNTLSSCPGVYYIPEEGEPVEVPSNIVGDSVVFKTDHFSVYAVVESNAGYSYETDASGFTYLTLTKTGDIKKNRTYKIQYSDNGTTWNDSGASFTVSNNAQSVSVTLSDTSILNSNVNRRFRLVRVEGGGVADICDPVNLAGLLDIEAPGFIDWLNGETCPIAEPTTNSQLMTAFDFYSTIPELDLNYTRDSVTHLLTSIKAVATPFDSAYTYQWQYYNGTAWVDFDSSVSNSYIQDPTDASFDAAISAGYPIRAMCYSGTTLLGYTPSRVFSNELTEAEKQSIVELINDSFDLYHYPIATYMVNQTVTTQTGTDDLSIGGTNFNTMFYYDAVAGDSEVPFSDAATYREYLIKTYLENEGGNAGLNAAKAVFDKYLYDLYDPNVTLGGKSNTTKGTGTYPDTTTYGDKGFTWPKEDKNYSPFHYIPSPLIKDLNYNYLEGGVDFTNMLGEVKKTAEAIEPGDANTNRKYDININAPVDSQISGPVVFIFQIQTSWQMFDLDHANRPADGNGTEKGAYANNTEIATLYDIKHALLDFLDYIESTYPAGNLAISITNSQHATTWNLVSGYNPSGDAQYVTNDYPALRRALLGWDIFGDCEHMHYGTDALDRSVAQLRTSVAGWLDEQEQPVDYDDVRKVVIAVGGATEKSTNENGMGCTLSWEKFEAAEMDAVYGIRTNSGTPNAYMGDGPNTNQNAISWIDATQNLSRYEAHNGEMLVASNRQAFYDTLMGIFQKEMNSVAHKATAEWGVGIDNFKLNDKVQREFEIDFSKNFVLTVDELTPIPQHSFEIDMSLATMTVDLDGSKRYIRSVPIWLIDSSHPHTAKITVVEHPDGTTDVSLDIDKVYNNETIDLGFRVKAREDYIGSNNVFTNIGRPEVSYTHTYATNSADPDKPNPLAGQTITYSRKSLDTPEVNVPIRFNVDEGHSISILLGDNSHSFNELANDIVTDAEYRAELYKQTNGTLTYTWKDASDYTVKTASVKILNGKVVGGDFPDYALPFAGTPEGTHERILHVIFTPEDTNDASRLGVNPLDQYGTTKINVVAPGSTTTFYVEKIWAAGDGGNDSVDFYLLQNGIPMKDALDQPIVYHLLKTDGWKTMFTDLPLVAGSDVIEYSVREINIPAGYIATYPTKGTQTDDSHRQHLYISFALSNGNGKNKEYRLFYTVDGVEHYFDVPRHDYTNYAYSPEYLVLSNLDTNLTLSDIFILGVASSKNKTAWGAVPNKERLIVYDSTVRLEDYVAGSIDRDVYKIINTPGVELPATGGIGFFYYVIASLFALSIGAVICIVYFKKKSLKGGQ